MKQKQYYKTLKLKKNLESKKLVMINMPER